MISMSDVQFQFQGPFTIFVLLHEAILSAKSILILIEMIDIPLIIFILLLSLKKAIVMNKFLMAKK